MSWLRLDDGFAQHPKIGALKDRELRVWLRVLCYCARFRTDGRVSESAFSEVPGFTKAVARRLLELHLLEVDQAVGLQVHDWKIYNGDTIEEKVLAYLETHPSASANEVQRAIGGKRELVLAIVAGIRAGGSPAVPAQFPNGTPPGTQVVPGEPISEPVSGSQSGSQSGSRAREPVLGTTKRESKERSLSHRPRDELWDILTEELGEPATRNERNKRNGALRQLREIGASAGELRERLTAYRTRWPALDITATAIVSNWTLLGRPAPQDRHGLTAADLIHAAKEAQ